MKTPPEDLAQKLIDASHHFTGTDLDVSIDEVAQVADVPRATLYYYFSGKDDLVAFFLNDKLQRVADAIAKAAASEGDTLDRLEKVIRSVLHAMGEHPALCTELPGAMRRMGNFAEVAANADRFVMAPVRELLIEGRAKGELDVPDIDVATLAMHGAIGQVALMELMRNGTFDADELADKLVPLVLRGLAAR